MSAAASVSAAPKKYMLDSRQLFPYVLPLLPRIPIYRKAWDIQSLSFEMFNPCLSPTSLSLSLTTMPRGRKKRKKRKHSAAPAPAPPAGEPLEQLEPGTRVAARDDSAAVWLAVFDGWVCDERRYARLQYLHWDSAGTPEVGIVPADWLLPEPDQRSKRPCDLRQGDVGLTEAEQDGGSVMMLARVLRVEGSVPVCRFLPRRDSRTLLLTLCLIQGHGSLLPFYA